MTGENFKEAKRSWTAAIVDNSLVKPLQYVNAYTLGKMHENAGWARRCLTGDNWYEKYKASKAVAQQTAGRA